ncbi:MAG: SDR family oxidoreductase [Dermatophilaceae bacterium]
MNGHAQGRPLAVVTGASSGIGRELARLAARDGHDVVIVARRGERLTTLAGELAGLGVDVIPVVADLAEPDGVGRVVDAVGERPLDVLINNAGIGGRGRFAVERQLNDDLAMLALNVTALVSLTGRILPGMVERGSGGILNVSSIAGSLPGPGQAVYNATKAFVTSFSLALGEETRGTGVRVTALCPGPVDTEFAAAAGHADPPTSRPLMRVLSAAAVAEPGWDGLAAGRALVVPDLATRVGLQTVRFLPWRWIARASAPRRRSQP